MVSGLNNSHRVYIIVSHKISTTVVEMMDFRESPSGSRDLPRTVLCTAASTFENET